MHSVGPTTEQMIRSVLAYVAGWRSCRRRPGKARPFAFLHPHTSMDLVRQVLDRME